MKVKPLVKDFISPEYKTESAGGMDIYFQEDVTLVAGKALPKIRSLLIWQMPVTVPMP